MQYLIIVRNVFLCILVITLYFVNYYFTIHCWSGMDYRTKHTR